jgi:phospholipid/cholesterol/gamma-HCH transport system substrate-binding protein
MSSLIREHLGEALAGLAVLAVAGGFLAFALDRTGTGGGTYELRARFPNASGIAIGSDVRVSGLKVGTVTAQRLDPESFQAVVTMAVNRGVELPADSSAAITSEGLLGGSFIALVPGGDSERLAPGDEITDTQGATDLMGLIGSVINRSGEPAAAPAP